MKEREREQSELSGQEERWQTYTTTYRVASLLIFSNLDILYEKFLHVGIKLRGAQNILYLYENNR